MRAWTSWRVKLIYNELIFISHLENNWQCQKLRSLFFTTIESSMVFAAVRSGDENAIGSSNHTALKLSGENKTVNIRCGAFINWSPFHSAKPENCLEIQHVKKLTIPLIAGRLADLSDLPTLRIILQGYSTWQWRKWIPAEVPKSYPIALMSGHRI